MRNTTSREVFISYAWGGTSEEFVDKLDLALRDKGITIIRDKRDLGYKGLIKEFMERIGKGKYVIVVISEKYLKSHNCMFELMQVSRNGDFYERILPIVLADVNIYDPIKILTYIRYWEEKKKELDTEMRKVGLEFLQGIQDRVERYTDIRNTIAQLTDMLANMNALSPNIHTQSGFSALCELIEHKIPEVVPVLNLEQSNSTGILEEITEAKSKKTKLDGAVTQLFDNLQDTISPDLKEVLDWLSNYSERARNIGKAALVQHPDFQKNIVEDLKKSRRFYKDIENCLYRLRFAIFTDNYLPINEAQVSLEVEVYKTVLDIVQARIPTHDKQAKEKFKKYIEHFKKRLDSIA